MILPRCRIGTERAEAQHGVGVGVPTLQIAPGNRPTAPGQPATRLDVDATQRNVADPAAHPRQTHDPFVRPSAEPPDESAWRLEVGLRRRTAFLDDTGWSASLIHKESDGARENMALSVEDVARSLVTATSSSRFVMPNYWPDSKTGIGYQVQVEVPQAMMKSRTDIEEIPLHANGGPAVLLRDVAEVKEGTMPGQVDRYSMRRLVSMTANIQGDDLGNVAEDVAKAIQDAGPPPAGVNVDVRGQVTPMNDLRKDLANGLLASVFVIFLLLTAYFQSIRLALTAVAAVPAVLCGVGIALLFTGTTLNLQSFMGAIMAVGVAVANSILLVTYAERFRKEGHSSAEAAMAGVRGRVRPILMTSAAMIAGMIPMAIGFGEGGDQTAPLGRAVIGGLLASTAATLILLPAVFTWTMGWRGPKSVSLDPTDPTSSHYVSQHEGKS